jgi:hypothetical protein
MRFKSGSRTSLSDEPAAVPSVHGTSSDTNGAHAVADGHVAATAATAATADVTAATTVAAAASDVASDDTAATFAVGDKVLCQFGGRRRPYPAQIIAVNDTGGDRTYDVRYNDDDVDTAVPASWLRRRQPVVLGTPGA